MVIALGCIAVGFALSQTPEVQDPGPVISTDRPSFGDSTSIVPPWRLQLESGYTFTRHHEDGVTVDRHAFPDTILRYGLVDDRLELRALWGGWNWIESRSESSVETAHGSSDISLGIKLKLTDQDEWVPRVLFVAQTTLGVGERLFSTREADPTFKLVWSHDLGSEFGLGGDATIAFPSFDGTHFAQGQGSINATYAVERATTFFAEYFIIAPTVRAGGPAHSVGVGALHLFGNRVQGDVRIGFGLNNRADGFFTGAGISVLF